MKSNLIQQFKLPNYIKGKSFADASKAIESKFKDRNDKYSMETKNILLQRLSDAQEHLKQGENPTNDQALGGFTDILNKGEGLEGAAGSSQGGPGAAGYLQAATGALDIGKDLFGKVDSSNVDPNAIAPTAGGGALAGAAKGASAGSSFGPWGAAIGGVVGGVSGVVNAGKQKDAILEAKTNTIHKDYNKSLSDYKYGGNMNNNYMYGGNDTDPNKESKRITLPKDNNSKISYANRKKLSNEQLSGFEDQQNSDNNWRSKRDSHYSSEFSKWRKASTGATPHDKYSQSAPEYQAAWKKIKSEFHRDNPRPINDIVMNYRETGPQGGGRGQTFGIKENKNNMLTSNEMAKGGYTNNYMNGGFNIGDIDFSKLNGVNIPGMTGTSDDYHTGNSNIDYKSSNTPFPSSQKNINFDINPGKSSNAEQSKIGKALNSVGGGLKDNYADILRYSPIAANALQLANLDEPDKESLDRLGNRYKPQYTDERELQNSISNSFNDGYLTDSSGGSQSRYAANARAAQLGKVRATSDAYLKSSSINRDENRRGQQFDLNVDQFNIGQSNRENEIDDRNEGAYDTEKSKLIGQIGTDIGNVGKEEKFKQMVKDSGLCYDSRGAYICGNGERVDSEKLKTINSSTNESKYGGNVENNKMFSSYFESMLNKNKS